MPFVPQTQLCTGKADAHYQWERRQPFCVKMCMQIDSKEEDETAKYLAIPQPKIKTHTKPPKEYEESSFI